MLPSARAVVGSKSLLPNPLAGQRTLVSPLHGRPYHHLQHTSAWLAAIAGSIPVPAQPPTPEPLPSVADAVYYHPTLNPMGIPPPGKPQK